jgi:HEAT repeat protein
LKLWLRDEKQDSKVRKAAVFFEWDVNRKPLHEVLVSLPPKLQNELVDQIVQTPRLRLRFLQEFRKFPEHKRYGNVDIFQVIAKFQKDLDLEVRAGAADALANLDGPKALALLDVALSDAEDFVRSTAAEALANHKEPGALRLIERALSDQVSSVREVAAWALAKQRGPGALQLLERALNDQVDDVRFAAAGALAELDGPEALRLLKGVALKDPSDYVKSAARDSLEAHRRRGTAGSIEDSLNCFEKN